MTRSQVVKNEVNIKLDELFNAMEDMKNEMLAMKDKLKAKDEQIDSLKSDIVNLKKDAELRNNRIEKLQNALDDEDAYVRRETIIFQGTAIPPAVNGEICNNVIREVIKDKLKIQLQPSDISVAHRAGKISVSQGPDHRGIQVRFCRRDIKRTIMMTKRDNSDSNQ